MKNAEVRRMKNVARETYQKLRALLDPKVASGIEHPPEDPRVLNKRRRDRVHIRILPVKAAMRPVNFWGARRCYYEILVGPWKTELGSCLGEVQFFRYAHQPKGIGKKFTPSVSRILGSAVRERTKSASQQPFTLISPGQGGSAFHLQRRYYANYARDLRSYPYDCAAKDLAELIKETLPGFQNLA